MIYTALTNKAMRFAYAAHHGQCDKNGIPYIFHPYHLAEQMPDEVTTCVALLHDVAEDTAVSWEVLEREFPPRVVGALRLLTHAPTDDYFAYIRALAVDPVARTVKRADLLHNLDESRYAGRRKPARDVLARRREKYKEALRMLDAVSAPDQSS